MTVPTIDAMLAELAAIEAEATRLRSQVIAAITAHLVSAPASPSVSTGEAPTSGTTPSTLAPLPRGDGGAPGPSTTRTPRSRYDLSKVAEVCRQAAAEERPNGQAVAEAMGVSIDMARNLISKARKAGHDVPRGDRSMAARRGNLARWGTPDNPTPRVPSAPKAPPPPDPVHAAKVAAARTRVGAPWTPAPGTACHVCDDCALPFERVTTLSVHTHATHHRPPSAGERRFSIWEGE